MKRRRIALALGTLACMVAVAALSSAEKPRLLLLDWAAKAGKEPVPVAVLIEVGLKDAKPTAWKNRATVTGAKVVRRVGYRFTAADKLTEPDGWEIGSRRPLPTGPKPNPAVAKATPIMPIGVVLHLTDVKADASLTVDPLGNGGEKASVPLKDVLAGKPVELWGGAGQVRLISTATPAVTAATEDDFPAAAYGPDGTLWLAYISYRVREEDRRTSKQQIAEQPANFKGYDAGNDYGDQLFVKAYKDGKWGEPVAVTGPNEDLVRCAIAVEKDGTVWVGYSAHRTGEHHIYTRPIAKKYAKGEATVGVGPEKRLTSAAGPHLTPVMCTAQDGHLKLTYQTWRSGRSVFGVFNCRQGEWATGLDTGGLKIGEFYFAGLGNSWYPAIAARPNGDIAIAYDSYEGGDYDVYVRFLTAQGTNVELPATSSKFEARPALAYDVKGRLWVAYEEGAETWGKDYGALDDKRGQPLYASRSVRVVCLQDGKLLRPTAELPTSKVDVPHFPYDGPPAAGPRYENQVRYAYPKLGLDGKGRLWLTYRQKFGTRNHSRLGSYWLTFARRLDGDHWSEPIELHFSDGLLDHRPVMLPHPNGGLVVLHNTDGRYNTPDRIDNQIYMSVVDLPGEPVEPKLVPHDPGRKDPKLVQAQQDEAAAVKRIREYRVPVGGKPHQFLRGEFHRHTEISWDGGPDGSLEDMWRYAIDAASMDWIGCGDHDLGGGREYTWWLVQKFTDAYHVSRQFTPMFTYERSVAYPHGHRNCMFARRGVRTLPRLAEPDPAKRVAGIHADDTKMLYRYLKELDGICAVHTSATSMGTDWRDNDPVVEPFVEIYQGDRMSYEKQEAPRAGYDPKTKKFPANIAGWFPDGYVDNALAKKGYKLGFQSSSDHWSTHISFCVALAERHDRQAILDALKKRHCYGATDFIVADVRSGANVMGDSFRTTQAPKLQLHLIGTKPLAAVDILKDSEVVETLKPGKAEYQGEWVDPKPTAGVHYYYVRARQTDDALAWTSPMWIDYAKE